MRGTIAYSLIVCIAWCLIKHQGQLLFTSMTIFFIPCFSVLKIRRFSVGENQVSKPSTTSPLQHLKYRLAERAEQIYFVFIFWTSNYNVFR
jgi:hypothetical protein